MEIIVPAAGRSSRFPNMKPKYLLYDYKGNLMLYNAVKAFFHLREYKNLHLAILREHDEQYHAKEFIKHELFRVSNLNIIELDKPTTGPAHTVYEIIKQSKIDDDSPIFIKDCDSFFNHEVTEGNYVCISNIKDHSVLKKLASKSFVITNDQGIISNIVEKSVVSDKFCVGGYKFNRAGDFVSAFEEIYPQEKEIFVSDVIQRCMHNGLVFSEKTVTNYVDVGTAEDWFEYNDKPVIFCDIDGTIIKAQGRVGYNNYDEQPIPLTKNIEVLIKKQEDGAQFIFVTARPKEYERQTRNMLNKLGFRDYQLLIGVQNSKRILINDFNNANPYPRAEAINIHRDVEELGNYL